MYYSYQRNLSAIRIDVCRAVVLNKNLDVLCISALKLVYIQFSLGYSFYSEITDTLFDVSVIFNHLICKGLKLFTAESNFKIFGVVKNAILYLNYIVILK